MNGKTVRHLECCCLMVRGLPEFMSTVGLQDPLVF